MPGSSGLAARVAAWKLRYRNLPGPGPATGEPSNGDPLQAELLIGGVWTDITSYVMQRDGSQKVTIPLRGQSGEGSTPDRSTCQFQLNNRDGRFTPRNPTGPYYGQIGRNTQIRFSVPNGYGGKAYRFWGEVSEWPQNWDPTGADIWVDAEASGPMRRYAQGHTPTRSVLYEALTGPDFASTLLEYWPCEDITGSATIASALSGHSPMTISGTPDLATYDQFGASDPLPTMTDSAFTGGVLKYADPTATQVRFLLAVPADGATDGKVTCRIHQDDVASTTAYTELIYVAADGTLLLRQHDADGALLGATLAHTVNTRGKLLRVSIELQENGTAADRTVRTLDVATGAVVSVTDTAALTAVERVLSVSMCPASISVVGPVGTRGITNGVVGHVTLQNAITPMTDLGDRINPAGETAGRRIQRVCAEHAIAVDWIGDLDTTAAMGAQRKLKPLELIQECAAADGGILYENLAVFGLGYRTRTSLYNQDPTVTLTYSAGQLSEVPVPVDDDQLSKNIIAVTRTDGNTVTAKLTTGPMSTAEPPAGIGEYGDPVTINVASDDQLNDQAYWRLHLGTVDEARFPKISVNLAHPQFTSNPALRTAVLTLRPGDRLAITGQMPGQAPDDVSVLVLGFAETIDWFQHTITFVCEPESPWRVGTVEDAVYGRLDTGGSVLAAPVTSGATTAYVQTTTYPLWTTSAADLPFDARVGGEVWTVTNITSSVNDTFTRTTANGWGTPDIGDAWTISGGADGDYSTTGTVAAHLLTTVNASRRTFVAQITDDWDLQCDMASDQLAAGDSIYPALVARYTNLHNLYMARLEFTTSQTVILSLRSRVGAGTETELATYTTTLTHAAGTYYRVRFKGVGANMYARVWLPAGPEPDVWQVTAADGTFSRADSIGTRSLLGIANTNVNPSCTYDNFQSLNPQTFTAARSVNTVTKAHSAGADIRLDHPTIIAL